MRIVYLGTPEFAVKPFAAVVGYERAEDLLRERCACRVVLQRVRITNSYRAARKGFRGV